MDKPIVRWTIGDVSEDGFKCLRRSVCSFLRLYGSKFEYYVCHNSIDPSKLNWVPKMGVGLIDQNLFKDSLDIEPIQGHGCWKLYPPEIKTGAYQIFVDNDLLLHKPLDLIGFVKEDCAFMTEALKKCYGTFDDLIEGEFNLNSGFLGLPKNFDLAGALNRVIAEKKIQWQSSYFEEQGLVAFVMHGITHKVIRLSEISVCLPDACRPEWVSPYSIGTCGVHFVGLNKGKSFCWRRYSTKML